MFQRPGSPSEEQHYQLAVGPITDFLRLYLINTHNEPSHSMIIRPGTIGKTEEDAALHLVVICEPELETSVRSFFTQPHIADGILRAPNGEKLGFFIISATPRMRSEDLDISVHCQDHFASSGRTYCGASIMLKTASHRQSGAKVRHATFGGIIKVIYGNGGERFFGVTAGHAVDEVIGGEEENEKMIEKRAYELEIRDNSWASEQNSLGKVKNHKEFPGITAGQAKLSHDWAIFDLETLRPNEAIKPECNQNKAAVEENGSHSILKASRPAFQDGLGESVLLLSGSHGSQRGELSTLQARMGESPGWICGLLCPGNGDRRK
jgi:hypothetical protein